MDGERCLLETNFTDCKRYISLIQPKILWSIYYLFSPCSGLILTVASKKNEEKTAIVENYLKYRLDDYKKYKKIFPSGIRNTLTNSDYDMTG